MPGTPHGETTSLDPESADYAGELTGRLRTTLGDKLLGVYLHGSAVLGDFLRERSDIDLIAVSHGPLSASEARAVADGLSSASLPCPAAGLEFHVVDRHAVERRLDPPPFELHLVAQDRLVSGHGRDGDPDLVMHFAVLHERGVALAGPAASAVFPAFPRERLIRAFSGELRWALEHASPSYQVLNAARAWRFSEENVLTSKLAGGEWARRRLDDPTTIDVALRHRRAESEAQPEAMRARAFVQSVLDRLEQRAAPSG